MGKEDNTVVPPALIADIGAGSYPAIMNILLALRKRDLNKEGSYIDISMTDGLFTFMFWALGKGFSKNEWSQNSDYYLSGGSPRYNIYETKDKRYLAVAPIEERFWNKFCDIYIEECKKTEKTDNLHPLLKEILIFIHPFAPFITEEIHSIIFKAPLIDR